MKNAEFILIEDALCKAFVLSLGTKLPSERALRNFISWINLQSKKDQKELNESYVYNCIPRYIDFLFSKS